LAIYLDQRWPGRVLSVNWGPWEIGLASAEVQQQFAKRGVGLISPSAGVATFLAEIVKGRKGEVEVIIGDGPWRREASSTGCSVQPDKSGKFLPLLDKITALKKSDGLLEIVKCLDPAQDLYLQDHRLDGTPVLPAAMAFELMAEAAQTGWPEWNVTALEDIRVFKGLVLNEKSRDVRLLVHPKGDMSPEAKTIALEVSITDSQHVERMYYRATVILDQRYPLPRRHEVKIGVSMKPFWTSVEEAYEKLLFHGPRFQCIRSIEGISEQGIFATLVPSLPGKCLANEPPGNWLMDPVVLDGGLQLALLWARNYLDITVLPSSFRAVHIFRPFHFATSVRCHLQVLEKFGKQTVYYNIYFMDREGFVLEMIERVEATGSSALNRLAESHPSAVRQIR